MVHVLAIKGMVGGAFLRAIGRVVGAVKVEQDALGCARALTLAQIEVDQRDGQAIAGALVHGIVEAREGRLGGERGASVRKAATDELEERVMAQGIGIILILVATGDLKDALADESFERVLAGRLRHSGTKEAIRAQRPGAVSAWASQGKPPSEVRRPPSKAACRGRAVEVAKE